jgi:hypothetical protein
MRKLVLLFIITISFFVASFCFASDNKSPIFQGATDTECIKFSGVDLTWVESFKTEDYVHYINRPVENAMVCHKREMLLFIIKGLEEVYIILGQEYPDKTQSWQLFEVDINDNDDEFTKRYKEMLLELVNMITEPEMWCM